jgi:hypothetical protein
VLGPRSRCNVSARLWRAPRGRLSATISLESDMNRASKGTRGELAVACWLMEQGYHAFINAAPNGPVDLVAVHPQTGETILIEVKSRRPYTRANGEKVFHNSNGLTTKQKELGIRCVNFNSETGECSWTVEAAPINQEVWREISRNGAFARWGDEKTRCCPYGHEYEAGVGGCPICRRDECRARRAQAKKLATDMKLRQRAVEATSSALKVSRTVRGMV